MNAKTLRFAPMLYDEYASFTPKQVAARNSVSETFVRDAIRDGRLIAYRLGGVGALRITRDSEALWIKGQIKPTDPPAIGVTPERSAIKAGSRRGK